MVNIDEVAIILDEILQLEKWNIMKLIKTKMSRYSRVTWMQRLDKGDVTNGLGCTDAASVMKEEVAFYMSAKKIPWY